MVDIKILKGNSFFKDLPEQMLEKIAEITVVEQFDEGTTIFVKDQALLKIYLLVSGRVSLKIPVDMDKMLSLARIEPGGMFGIHALMEENASSFTAVCKTDCSIVSISGTKIHQLFREDFKMAHILMIQVVKMLKMRMEDHTTQFLNSLAQHPDVMNLKTV